MEGTATSKINLGQRGRLDEMSVSLEWQVAPNLPQVRTGKTILDGLA